MGDFAKDFGALSAAYEQFTSAHERFKSLIREQEDKTRQARQLLAEAGALRPVIEAATAEMDTHRDAFRAAREEVTRG
mgnify:CR=1 FL=1